MRVGVRPGRLGPAVLAALALLAVRPASSAADSLQFVVFGDSLSDTGNVYLATGGTEPSAPYFNGRYSNGPVWVEQLAAQVGAAAPTPSEAGGLNFAYGGAQTGPGLSSQGTPNLSQQVSEFLGTHTPTAGQVFVVWAGANDLLTGANTPEQAAANVASSVSSLLAAGAQSVLVGNALPLGQTPGVSGSDAAAGLGAAAASFNDALNSQLNALESSSGVDIARLDAAGVIASAIADPTGHGLTNVTDSALTLGDTDGDGFLFWDGLNLTTKGNSLLADAAGDALGLTDPPGGTPGGEDPGTGGGPPNPVEQTPEPASVIYFGIAAAAAVYHRRRGA
jgi:thermolabile hemolysin